MIIKLESINEICDIVNEASGALTQLLGMPVELRIIKPIIEGINYTDQLKKRIETDLQISAITNIVCEQYMVSPGDLRGGSKLKLIVNARKTAAHMMFGFIPDISTIRVGLALNRDHSTAIYYRDCAEDHILLEKDFRYHYNKCAKAYRNAIAGEVEAAVC